MEKLKKKEANSKDSEKVISIAYLRVSSVDNRQQLGLAVQADALKHCDYIFSEKQSGSDDLRPKLAKAISLAKRLASQDKQVTFCVYKMDRLSRRTSTLLKIIEELKDCNIEFVSIKEDIDTSTPTGVLMYQLLGIFAEFELNKLRQRTKEGLQKARENGAILGRPALTDKKKQKILDLYQLHSMSIKDMSKRLNVSESSIFKTVKESGIKRRKHIK